MSASTPLPNAPYPPPPCRVGPRPSDWTHRRPIHPVARFEALFSARPWCLWTLAAQRATGRARIQPRFHTCMSQDILCMRCLALCGGACIDLDVIGLGHAWDEIVDKGIFLVQDLNCGARARHKHTHAHASTQTHTHTHRATHTHVMQFSLLVSARPWCRWTLSAHRATGPASMFYGPTQQATKSGLPKNWCGQHISLACVALPAGHEVFFFMEASVGDLARHPCVFGPWHPW
jgi:hypothetical protein